MAEMDTDGLIELDVAARRHGANALLLRASELLRAGIPGPPLDYRGADLIGARLPGADLRGANLRGALLIGADLSGADLGGADLGVQTSPEQTSAMPI
jgi:hypothetical protein